MLAHVYRWKNGDQDNPYYGYLALADQLVVTGESTSMLAEANATGKPLFIFDLGNKPDTVPSPPVSLRNLKLGCKAAFVSPLQRLTRKPRYLRRDIGNIQRMLTATGNAFWLGQSLPPNHISTTTNQLQHDMERAVERIHRLFDNH